MGFAGQVFAARVAIGLAMPSPRALTQAGSILAKFTGGVYKKLNREQTKASSDRLRLAKQDLKRVNKAISQLQKEQDNSIRGQAKNSIRKTQAMFNQSAFQTKKSVQDFKQYISKVQPAVAPRLFAGMNKDMSAAQRYQKIVDNFISLGKEERKVILNNMKARSQAMKQQSADFKDLVNVYKSGRTAVDDLPPSHLIEFDAGDTSFEPGKQHGGAEKQFLRNVWEYPMGGGERRQKPGGVVETPGGQPEEMDWDWYEYVTDKGDEANKTLKESEELVRKIDESIPHPDALEKALNITDNTIETMKKADGHIHHITGFATPGTPGLSGKEAQDALNNMLQIDPKTLKDMEKVDRQVQDIMDLWEDKSKQGPKGVGAPGHGIPNPFGDDNVPIDKAVDFLDDIVEQYKHLKEIDRERNDQSKLDLRELTDLEEWRRQAQKELEEATKALAEAEKQLADETQRVIEETQQVIYLFKGEFLNNIRETISALAGFFWQLQSLTDELVEFERELLNANSVFNLTRDNLFATGEAITQFGQEFGMSMQNGATGLYQLASAGVTANEALMILPNTLKLSMAVQGDHNTISKLTAQTLFGFSLPMSQAAEVTDKFAYAIQKSLIEYQDLASAIKFALPFFTATGQSLDQLLGALQVLTNRALEAGIAGRGLRQALSEFAEHADDNAAAFRKVGLEIINMDGTMKQLTEIASEYADIVGVDAVASTELLTSLIQDLNVRGATAFIHLVQNADEFAEAVENTTNAGGELDQMVNIQNESINAQIQILKNNVQAIFFMRDATFEGTEYLNGFHKAVLDFVETPKGLLVVQLQDGTYALTEFSQTLQDIAIKAIEMFTKASQKLVEIIRDFTEAGFFNISMLKAFFAPLTAVLKVIQMIGPDLLKLYISFRIYSRILGLEAIPYTRILRTGMELLGSVMKFAKLALMGLIQNVTLYSAAVMGGEGAMVATDLWAASLGKLKGLLGGLVRILFSWQAIAVVAVATLAIAASTAQDWSNITQGLSLGFKELIATLWVGLEPLIISIQNARDAFGGWLGDVSGMETRMVLIRMMQEIGAFLGLFVQLGAKLLGFFVDIGTSLGGWFTDLDPEGDSYFGKFVNFWEDFFSPDKQVDWLQAIIHSLGFVAHGIASIIEWLFDSLARLVTWALGDMAESIPGVLTAPGMEYYDPDQSILTQPWVLMTGVGGMQGLAGTSGPGALAEYSTDPDLAHRQQGWSATDWADYYAEMVATNTSLENSASGGERNLGQPQFLHDITESIIETGGGLFEYLTSLQGGGAVQGVPRYAGGGPLLVGELGPEIFVPSTSGRIIANKDLNTMRTQNMLSDWRDRGAGGGGGSAGVMVVGTLVSDNSISKNSKISIDSYAGVV